MNKLNFRDRSRRFGEVLPPEHRGVFLRVRTFFYWRHESCVSFN